MSLFLRTIRKMDIFGQPINLNLDLRSKYQTFLGGLVSMFIVFLLIGYSVNEIIGYTIQRGIQITQEVVFSIYRGGQTKFNYDPDVLVLNNQNFIFAIRVEQDSFYQSPQFDIQVRQHQNSNEVSLELQQCTFQQFVSVLNSSQVLDFLEANQVNTWLCPKSEFSIELEGTAFSSIFSSLVIEISECKSRSSWGSECQSRTQKDSYKVQMITKNTFINPFNNEFVAEDYLDNSMSLYFQPGDLQRIDYQFHKHITKDYQGQIKIEGLLDEQEWSIFSTNSFKQIYEGKNTAVWSRIVFTRSNFSTSYNREYQTVTDLLSKIGGLSQSVISIVGSTILFGYIQPEHDQGTKGSGLVDPLQYSVQLHQESSQPLKKKRKTQDKTDAIKQPEEDSMEDDPQFKERVMRVVEEQKQIMDKYQFKSRKHFLLATFQQTILMKKSIQLSLKYFFYKLFCQKSDPKEDPHLFVLQKALTSVRQELDVFSILNRIHQLEKLKKILLDRDQLILFNYSPKPVIAVYEKDKETDFLHYSKQQSLKQMTLIEVAEDIKKRLKTTFLSKEHLSIENVFNSYKAIASKNRKSNRYYYKINRKLKQFLGDQVKAIIKASKILKFPEDDHIPDMGVLEIMSVGGETAAQYPLSIYTLLLLTQNLHYLQFQFTQALRIAKLIYYIENSLLRKVTVIDNTCSDSVIVQAEVSMICTDGKLVYSLLENGDIYQIEQPPRLLKSGTHYKWISPIAAIDQSHRGFIWKTNKQIYSHCKHISSYQNRITLITIGGKIFNVVDNNTLPIPQLNGLKLNTYFKKSILFSFGGVAITESGEFYLFNQKMIRVKIKGIQDIFSTDKYLFAIQNNNTILQYSIEDIQTHQFFTNQQIFQKMHYCNDLEFKYKQKQFQHISILQSEYSLCSFAYIKENKILDTSLNLTDHKTNQTHNKSNVLILKQSLFEDWDCKKKTMDSRRSTTIDKPLQIEPEGLTLAQKLATIRESLNFEKPTQLQDNKDRCRQKSLIQFHQSQVEDLPYNPTPIKLDNLLNKIHVNKPDKPIDQLLLSQNKQELQDSLPTFQNDNQFTKNNDTLNKKKSKQNNGNSRSNKRLDSMSAQSGIDLQNNSGFIQQQDSFVDILDTDSNKKDFPLQLQPFDKPNKYKKNTLETIQSYENEQDPKTTNRLSHKKDQVLQQSNRSPNTKTLKDPLLTERSSTKRNIEQAKQDLETLVNMINKQKENTETQKSVTTVKSSIRMMSPPIQVGSALSRPESKITPLKNRRSSVISETSQQESFKLPQRISKQSLSQKLITQQSFNSSSQNSQFQFDSNNFRQLNTLQDQESQLDFKSANKLFDQSITQQLKKIDQIKGLKKVQCSSQVNILRNNSLSRKSTIIVNNQQTAKMNLRRQEAILKKLFFRLDVRLKLQQLEFVNNLKCLL
ncbi:unnamed protein product [Paramecium octaurelia]|uniref:Transmembrane protein n=1 Tax=Paramecium octaurelia TaxID=43137 RepID=A0A8S1WVE8_PAROT|nr:unnamed protein product [Paramecium octaurelia]